MIPDRLLENRQGALADLVLLKRTELSLVELGLGDVDVLTKNIISDIQTRIAAIQTSWRRTRRVCVQLFVSSTFRACGVYDRHCFRSSLPPPTSQTWDEYIERARPAPRRPTSPAHRPSKSSRCH